MLFITASSGLKGGIGGGTLIVKRSEETIPVALSQRCHLRCLQYLASLLNDRGDSELADRLSHSRCSLFNRPLQFT